MVCCGGGIRKPRRRICRNARGPGAAGGFQPGNDGTGGDGVSAACATVFGVSLAAVVSHAGGARCAGASHAAAAAQCARGVAARSGRAAAGASGAAGGGRFADGGDVGAAGI